MKIIKILLALMLCAAPALAQKVSVTAQAPSQVVEGRNFTVSLSVENGEADPVPAPPQIANSKFVYGPVTSTSQSYKTINGQVTLSMQTTYTYTYKAEMAGTTAVPSMAVMVNDISYTTKRLSIDVAPPNQTSEDKTADLEEVQIDSCGLFVRVIADKTTIYVDQPFTATVKIYTQYDIASFHIKAKPEFKDCFIEEIPYSGNGRKEEYNGKEYFVAELSKFLVYPQKPGQLEIAPGQYELTVVLHQPERVGPFINYITVEKPFTIKNNPVSVTVLPSSPKDER